VIWGAIAFCGVAVLGSLAYAAVRGLRLWRTFRATTRRGTAALDRVLASAASAEEHALGLTAGAERLATATGSLQEALAEIAAIRAAAAEPRAFVTSVRGLVPRK
jgi:hypothetical protein